jgi:hypothetical protein
VLIPLAQLHPHPGNPRLVIRQEVVDGIAVTICPAAATGSGAVPHGGWRSRARIPDYPGTILWYDNWF